MTEESSKVVSVIGAEGFIGSWLVKLLLSGGGYTVHATVRSLADDNIRHLKSLDKAAENLKLFKAELLDYHAIRAAIEGCDGVFHVAGPILFGSIPNPEAQLVEPILKGTLNILRACSELRVRRAVIVSSAGAVFLNPDWPEGREIDENCWSDVEFCRRVNQWYCYSKTVAETEAWKFAEETGLDIVTLCPTLTLGPMLQPTVNVSSLSLTNLLKGGNGGEEEIDNEDRRIVDVRDLVEALRLVYETPGTEGRYICAAHNLKTRDLVEILKRIYPSYGYLMRFTEGKELIKLSSKRLQSLGWTYRPLEETLVDSVESYKRAGILD